MTHSARIARAALLCRRRYKVATAFGFADTPASDRAWRRFRRASDVLAARRARADRELAAVFGEAP